MKCVYQPLPGGMGLRSNKKEQVVTGDLRPSKFEKPTKQQQLLFNKVAIRNQECRINVSPKLRHKNGTNNPFQPKCFWPSKAGRWEPYPASLSFLVELGLVLLDLLVHLLHPQLHKIGGVCVELHAVFPILPEQTHTQTHKALPQHLTHTAPTAHHRTIIMQ